MTFKLFLRLSEKMLVYDVFPIYKNNMIYFKFIICIFGFHGMWFIRPFYRNQAWTQWNLYLNANVSRYEVL